MEIEAIGELIKWGVAIVAALWGLWNEISKRRVGKAYNKTEEALEGMIAALELVPQTEEIKKLKMNVHWVQKGMGRNEDTVVPLINKVVGILERYGVWNAKDEDAKVARAAKAIQIVREKKRK